jgi:uncharacterized membrane protein
VIALIASLLGVLFALMAASSNSRRGKAKVRALIASDQAILQSLAPGSLAAIQLDARIQATVTVYASNFVLPSARRGAAVMGVISMGFMAGSLALAVKNHSSEGDQFVYPLVSGFFAANVGFCVRILLHRNQVWAAPEPEATGVGQGVAAEDDGRLDELPEALPNP